MIRSINIIMEKGGTMNKEWNQLPNETSTAYDRFKTYLELGGDRSLEKVRQKYTNSTSYKRQLAKWSSKHHWVGRAKAYDEHLMEQLIEEQEVIIKKSKSILLNAATDSANELVKIALSDGKQRLNPDEISHMSQKLKAIEIILDRIGLRVPNKPVEKKELTMNQYIQNIYDRIDQSNFLDDDVETPRTN